MTTVDEVVALKAMTLRLYSLLDMCWPCVVNASDSERAQYTAVYVEHEEESYRLALPDGRKLSVDAAHISSIDGEPAREVDYPCLLNWRQIVDLQDLLKEEDLEDRVNRFFPYWGETTTFKERLYGALNGRRNRQLYVDPHNPYGDEDLGLQLDACTGIPTGMMIEPAPTYSRCGLMKSVPINFYVGEGRRVLIPLRGRKLKYLSHWRLPDPGFFYQWLKDRVFNGMWDHISEEFPAFGLPSVVETRVELKCGGCGKITAWNVRSRELACSECNWKRQRWMAWVSFDQCEADPLPFKSWIPNFIQAQMKPGENWGFKTVIYR